MKNAIRVLSAALILGSVIVAAGCLGEPARFETANLESSDGVQKSADKYWKREGWWGGLKNVKKVAITQFNVEYVTENIDKSGASAISVLGAAEMIGLGRRKREFTEEFKASFPDKLYGTFVAALQEQGYEVVPVETLTSHASFSKLKAAAAGQASKQSGRNLLGQADHSQQARIQTYPTKALPLPDSGFLGFGAADNAKAEAAMVGDSGGQAALRVRIRVALDDEGRAIIGGGSSISVGYEPESYQNMNERGWYFKQAGQLTGHGSMRDEVPVIDKKEFQAFKGDIYTVNSTKFEGSILKMFPAYAKMSAIKLKG